FVQLMVYGPWSLRANASGVVAVMIPAQLSFAVGTGISAAVTAHSLVMVAKVATAGTGAVTSSTTMVCCCVVVLPLPSLYVQLMVSEGCRVGADACAV